MNNNILKKFLKSQASGFALIATISVMSLVIMIAMAMVGLSTSVVRTSQHGRAMEEAQANARMALVIAIGKLQIAMGPDTRISARAELLAKDPRVNNTTILPNTPQAWWVGAASSDPTQGVDISDPNKKVVWLISGLDSSSTPSDQLSTTFSDPIAMYGHKTIDTAGLTGGKEIMAGKVSVSNPTGDMLGKFAWFIDDNGMKAQLAAFNPEVKNDRDDPYGGGVTPGTYDLSILDGMGEVAGSTPDEFHRLISVNDLPFLAKNLQIVPKKRMSYTTRSRGVLANVKDGGLKKDLTVAFENEDAFDSIWGSRYDDVSEEFDPNYIVMDPEKFGQSSDLVANGYIHWEMFKDYYNTKKYIQTDSAGMEFIYPTLTLEGAVSLGATKYKHFAEGPNDNTQYPSLHGVLGPHAIGNNLKTHPYWRKFPYGDHLTIADANNANENQKLDPRQHYKHSPITPVLMRMQLNGWLETIEKDDEFTPEPDLVTYIETNCQMFFTQYNPYNVRVRVRSGASADGPMMGSFPKMRIAHSGMQVEYVQRDGAGNVRLNLDGTPKLSQGTLNRDGLLNDWLRVGPDIKLAPGRSHVFAFEKDLLPLDNHGEYTSLFNDKVKNVVTQSVHRDYRLISATPGPLEVIVGQGPGIRGGGLLTHGASTGGGSKWGTMNYGAAQVFWAPYSYGSYASWKFKEDNVGLDDFNENLMASFSFHLRTSTEPATASSPAIRPLVDSNIRAMLNNPRWDSPLGLPVAAAYSMASGGEVDAQIMQMKIEDPKGYAYWGAGRDPVDGYDRVVLFDIPREDLISLGQLQHANVGRFSYEPTYIVGNSYTNLRIPQDQWKDNQVTDTFSDGTDNAITLNNKPIAGTFSLYDASYLVNEVLWDSSIFTTIPQVNDNTGTVTESKATEADYRSLLNGDTLLANPRFLPYTPSGSLFNLANLQTDPNAYHHNAGYVMVDGAFNVNSTSIDAWEAFLCGTKGLPYLKQDGNGSVTGFGKDVDGVRFPRLKATIGGPMDKDALDENYWAGFRSLKNGGTDGAGNPIPNEVRELATEIVAEIKKRGPFLTMGEFVNRKLETGELGQRGALQAALDNTVNKDIDSNFSDDTNVAGIPVNSKQGSGFPGHLLQGDVLQALSPFMTVRSDTFTIRAYGETLSRDGKTVLARAWCEAIVQRYPDPVPSSGGGDALAELANPTSTFGRAFRITSFRWLNPTEI